MLLSKRWTTRGGEMVPPTPTIILKSIKRKLLVISSSWPIMKSNWLWLSSIINESNGSPHLQAIWQMALSIYYCACHSGSFSKWFLLWNLVIKGFVLQAFFRFWHSLCSFFFLWLWQERSNPLYCQSSFFPSLLQGEWDKKTYMYSYSQWENTLVKINGHVGRYEVRSDPISKIKVHCEGWEGSNGLYPTKIWKLISLKIVGGSSLY